MQKINDKGYMLDTNLFNRLVEGKLSVAAVSHLRLLATHVQLSELRATKNLERRNKLLAVFDDVGPEIVLSAFLLDIEGAGLDQGELVDPARHARFARMLERLQALEAKRRDARNQIRDIAIAEKALDFGATLVTDDPELGKVMEEFGGRAINHFEFEREAQTPR
jgi:predicted nucleic acid-binding protein